THREHGCHGEQRADRTRPHARPRRPRSGGRGRPGVLGTKRLEPRLIQLHRRGVLTLYDLIRAAAHVPAALPAAGEATHDMESRIRALGDGLDAYIRGVALASIDSPDYPFVIEDTRKERGDYDEFFRIAKPPHAGTLTERIARLEHELRKYQHLLGVLMRALIDKGVLTMQQLERQR